jgi:hypothetical protein
MAALHRERERERESHCVSTPASLLLPPLIHNYKNTVTSHIPFPSAIVSLSAHRKKKSGAKTEKVARKTTKSTRI